MADSDLPGLALGAVTAWLSARGLVDGPVDATLVAGGRSNLTYVLSSSAGPLVLRRPPLGHVLATAHDMAREHRVLSALHGTAVPVPRPLALCADADVTGAPFYVMSYAEGLVVRGPADAAALPAQGRVAVVDAMMATLAALHAVDPSAVGLGDFGRPSGFLERQVRRWGAQLDASHVRDLPGVDTLRSRLAATVPSSSGAAIVHGDYRLDNLVVGPPGAPDEYAVRAVLDWEMATLGDPLADLGLLVAYWEGLGRLPASAVAALGPAAGFPGGDALVAQYTAASGRDVAALPWYVAFGFFKIAVILEGIHYRFVQGATVGAGFDRIGEVVPALIALGLSTI
ncbi:MAG TPA: phosphotransferase family protein [Kineosporiaceae bacterium]|nr:phosphotransferase family protein [Kineosporiaceae bacterium]